MTDKEILFDLLDDFAGTLHWTLHAFPPMALHGNPPQRLTALVSRSGILVVPLYLAEMPMAMLYQPPAGWPDASHTAYQPATAYECMRNILMDMREHLGEIKAIKAMWQRRATQASVQIDPV